MITGSEGPRAGTERHRSVRKVASGCIRPLDTGRSCGALSADTVPRRPRLLQRAAPAKLSGKKEERPAIHVVKWREMHLPRFLQAHIFLVAAVLAAAPLPAQTDSSVAHSKLVGSYISSPENGQTEMSVSLGADGTATVTEDFGKGPQTYFGRWTESGGQAVVTFTSDNGGPAEPPMTFQVAHGGLEAVTWDHAQWGKLTPPPMKKSGKIKSRRWTGMNP